MKKMTSNPTLKPGRKILKTPSGNSLNNAGNRYRNKFETRTGEWLNERSISFEYETERLQYTVTGKYVPDFILRTRSGRKIYIETKGNGRSFDGPSRRKLIAVRSQHPEKDIRIVFYANGVIGPRRKDSSRLTQGEWATKNGFKWSIREIPESWLDE